MPLLHTKPQTHYITGFQYESVSEIRGVILAGSSQIEASAIAKAITFLHNRHIWIALITSDKELEKKLRDKVQYSLLLDERLPLTEVMAEIVSKSNMPSKHLVALSDQKRLLGLAQQQGTQASEITSGEQLLAKLAEYLP